jgi:hypothetical protein
VSPSFHSFQMVLVFDDQTPILSSHSVLFHIALLKCQSILTLYITYTCLNTNYIIRCVGKKIVPLRRKIKGRDFPKGRELVIVDEKGEIRLTHQSKSTVTTSTYYVIILMSHQSSLIQDNPAIRILGTASLGTRA